MEDSDIPQTGAYTEDRLKKRPCGRSIRERHESRLSIWRSTDSPGKLSGSRPTHQIAGAFQILLFVHEESHVRCQHLAALCQAIEPKSFRNPCPLSSLITLPRYPWVAYPGSLTVMDDSHSESPLTEKNYAHEHAWTTETDHCQLRLNRNRDAAFWVEPGARLMTMWCL